MAHHVEPMDVDCMDSDFDNKENTYHHTNVPCTEKGYEELDVSELNMKLRYSNTPATSPMSKSFTAYVDNRNHDSDDSLNCTIENINLTCSLNSTMTENASIIQSLKTLPLQTISTEQVLRQLDSTVTGDDNNVTVTISPANDVDENLYLPSSSSSVLHTPEATTPTNISKSDEDSPIIRGLKSVFNMFRSSQSPIPSLDHDNSGKQEDETYCEDQPETLAAIASTPISAQRSRDGSTSKRSSPLKDSIVFSDDLEKELQWKDETILFSEEKIPIHKLFLPQTKPTPIVSASTQKDHRPAAELNLTVEYMDVSYNSSMVLDHTVTETHNNNNIVESDGEFLDCETIFTKNESQNNESNANILKGSGPLEIFDVTKEIENENEYGVNESVEKTAKQTSEFEVASKSRATWEILQQNVPAVNETEDNKENEKNLTTGAIMTLDVTSDIAENVPAGHENVPSYNNVNQKTPITDAVNALDITKDIINENVPDVNENLESRENSEIRKEPSADTSKNLDLTIELVNEKVLDVTECGIQENYINSVVVVESTEGDVSSPPKSDQKPAEIRLYEKSENETTDNAPQNVKLDEECISSLEEKLKKGSTVMENLNASNEIHETEVTSKDDREAYERDINITQLIECKKTTDKEILDTHMISTEPQIRSVPNIETKIDSDVQESQNVTIDPHEQEYNRDLYYIKNNTEHKLEEYPLEDIADRTMNASPEDSIAIEGQTQLSNNFDAMTKETPKEDGLYISNVIAEEPANIPLPDDDDFDIDLGLNNNKVETIQTIIPDVLDILKNESKLNVSETLDKFLNDTNIIENKIGEAEVIPSSEKVSILNETNDIVNSLNQIIGESLNNTMIQCIDQSQSENWYMEGSSMCRGDMLGVECTDEIQLLPDLVNETINNTTVECKIIPELTSQSQSANRNETVDKTHNLPTEDFKPIPETDATVVKSITEQSNESITPNKEHTDVISVSIENIDVALERKIHEKFKAEVEKKVNEALNVDINPDAKLKEIYEVPIVDEELVVSENNSSYVSLIAETETTETRKGYEKNDISFTTNKAPSSPPSSPPIRSKGYNFNFDEMDDPFALQTKIRLSPPPTPSKFDEPDQEKDISGEFKKLVPNRRRSQPPERKRPTFNKKKFSTTFDSGSATNYPNNISDDLNSEGDSKNASVDITNDTTVTMEINNAADKEVTSIHDCTQVFEKLAGENIDASPENYLSNVIFEEKVRPAAEISADDKASIESMTTSTNEIKISSSEQSTYYSAAASSSDCSIPRNVFNLPEIDDKNFNPFATKSKMRLSPPLECENENALATKEEMRLSPDSSLVVKPSEEKSLLYTQNIMNKLDSEDKMDRELMEKDTSYNVSNTTSSSKSTGDKTTREVNTEDEDTEEGPFLEAEDAIEKLLGIDNDDMMQFSETAQASDENVDGRELFIDAEAFEFLLNQNKSNIVADSGKESLFLKFDPLFATRISSDGVLAALNKVQKRQSTPVKPTRPSLRNEASPIAGPSTLNATYEGETNVTQESIEDLNVTVAKPMMVVTPAVNPAITTRNKITTPPRSNRRSITLTSPAMAVIDRLLSLSGNHSLLGHDTTIRQASREHTEADIALIQLRELLAEKEISVFQLRSESKELKDRLSTMETQVMILEADGKERLNKINELNDRLAKKTKVNKSMAAVVEEYERTIASLIAETEQDKKRHAKERTRLINERDEQTAHLASMEVSFSDLHSKYEKSKQVILSFKANEETYKKSIKDFEENLTKMQTNYEMLKQHATSKLNQTNQELLMINKTHESEVLKLNAMMKRKEMHITSLEETLVQKTKANEELTAICDELINKVG